MLQLLTKGVELKAMVRAQCSAHRLQPMRLTNHSHAANIDTLNCRHWLDHLLAVLMHFSQQGVSVNHGAAATAPDVNHKAKVYSCYNAGAVSPSGSDDAPQPARGVKAGGAAATAPGGHR